MARLPTAMTDGSLWLCVCMNLCLLSTRSLGQGKINIAPLYYHCLKRHEDWSVRCMRGRDFSFMSIDGTGTVSMKYLMHTSSELIISSLSLHDPRFNLKK